MTPGVWFVPTAFLFNDWYILQPLYKYPSKFKFIFVLSLKSVFSETLCFDWANHLLIKFEKLDMTNQIFTTYSFFQSHREKTNLYLRGIGTFYLSKDEIFLLFSEYPFIFSSVQVFELPRLNRICNYRLENSNRILWSREGKVGESIRQKFLKIFSFEKTNFRMSIDEWANDILYVVWNEERFPERVVSSFFGSKSKTTIGQKLAQEKASQSCKYLGVRSKLKFWVGAFWRRERFI